jgi:hypothetical protein
VSDNIDPKVLFDLIAHHLPAELHPHVLVAGSLAAAYHHRERLIGGVINTKDADVVIQPTGAIAECERIAKLLLAKGWRRTDACFARPTPTPTDRSSPDEWLRAIRLFPKDSNAYFLELLSFPAPDQIEIRRWVPCRLDDGWYGLPCFRYMGLTATDRRLSDTGISYASPALMALANLLSHPTLRPELVILKPEEGRTIMRSAKDLGRVLALAWLAPTDELRQWVDVWRLALRDRFPSDHDALARRAGDGLRALLSDPDALDQARHSVDTGLLRGHGIDAARLRVVGEQVIAFALDPLAGR